jgi:hypothetical protein
VYSRGKTVRQIEQVTEASTEYHLPEAKLSQLACLEEPNQPKLYQLDAIWREVLGDFSQYSDIQTKLFRDYGELLAFDEMSACVRLRLFANSWLMRLNKQVMEKVLKDNFRLAKRLAIFQMEQDERQSIARIARIKKIKKLLPEIELRLINGLTKRGAKLTKRGETMKIREIESLKKELQTLEQSQLVNNKLSIFTQVTLSEKFYVRIEIEEIYNYLPDQLLSFQYRTLDRLLPFPLPSVPLSERHQLPTCTAVYFVLEGDSVTNSRILYVGQAVNLKKRWQGHNQLKQLKSGGSNLRVAWLECRNNESVLSIIEAAFIQSLEPELNQSKHPAHIWTRLRHIGWDAGAADKIRLILGKIDKTKDEEKIFVEILQELLLETAKFRLLPVPENWNPRFSKDIVVWVHNDKEVPCIVSRISWEKSEAEIFLSAHRETVRAAKERGLSIHPKGFISVPLSELRPAQGIGLHFADEITLVGRLKVPAAETHFSRNHSRP